MNCEPTSYQLEINVYWFYDWYFMYSTKFVTQFAISEEEVFAGGKV